MTSLLRQALIHMLKAEAWPLSRDPPSWRADAIDFRSQASDRYTLSMRQRLNLARIYRQALRAIPDTIDGIPPLSVPETCPTTLEPSPRPKINGLPAARCAGSTISRRMADFCRSGFTDINSLAEDSALSKMLHLKIINSKIESKTDPQGHVHCIAHILSNAGEKTFKYYLKRDGDQLMIIGAWVS